MVAAVRAPEVFPHLFQFLGPILRERLALFVKNTYRSFQIGKARGHFFDGKLRGDPSDGLPGLKGVGPAAASQLIRTHGGIAGVLRDAHVADHDRDYLERAMRVVPPVPDLPIAVPAGRRGTYPVDAAALAALTTKHGLTAASNRLVAALAGMPSG